ncbi:hypothetical protein H7169_03845 [Candidatus Gracilibacteria bacterium]|nr:hypothetical protein [Candidatus Gracilibacteria bacterium]
MTLHSRLIIGLIATASFPIISFGTDATNIAGTPRIYDDTEIAYIRSINCDILTSDAKTLCLDIKKSTLIQTTVESDKEMNISKLPNPPMGTGATSNRLLLPAIQKRGGDENSRVAGAGSGGGPRVRMILDGTGTMMGSGKDMADQMHGLNIAIGKLTPADRDTLVKMIREYLTSKGITIGAPEVKKDETERKGWDGSIKGKKTDTETQTDRATLLEKAKAKREAMKKEYVGNVTLMK